LPISAPCERDTLWGPSLLADIKEFWYELIDLALLLQVKDNDGGGGSSTEPVAIWRENKGVDLVVGIKGVKVLGLVQVPEHGGTVLTTGSAERTVGGDGDGINVAGVTNVVGLDAAGRELPDLNQLVPTSRHNDGVLGVRAESHARDPLGVSLVGDGEFAVTQGVPQLDGPITRARDDLSVVGREGNGEDIVGVADETTGGLAARKLPQTEGLVP